MAVRWKRRIRKAFGFDHWKLLAVYGFSALAHQSHRLPDLFFKEMGVAFEGLLKLSWYLPFHPWRRAACDMVRIGGQGGCPRDIYYHLVEGTLSVGLGFLDAWQKGIGAVRERIRLNPDAVAVMEDVNQHEGKAIIVLPHLLGGIFSAAKFAEIYPILILSKGPKNPKRAEVQREFMAPLGLNLLVLDRTSSVLAARQFLKALKNGHSIVGTTDLNYKRDDTLPATIFGQPVHFPGWPARFARQARVPIVPGFVQVRGQDVEILLDQPIRERDVEKATQAWASVFEKRLLASPRDWAFLVDRRWGQLLRRSARVGWHI